MVVKAVVLLGGRIIGLNFMIVPVLVQETIVRVSRVDQGTLVHSLEQKRVIVVEIVINYLNFEEGVLKLVFNTPSY